MIVTTDAWWIQGNNPHLHQKNALANKLRSAVTAIMRVMSLAVLEMYF